MTNPISGLGALTGPAATPSLLGPSSGTAGTDASNGFGKMLFDAIESTAAMETKANSAVESHLVGGDVQMSEVFTALKKADLALRTMVQVRNKLLEAYDEIQQLRM